LAEDFDHRVIVRKSFRHLGVRYVFQWNLQHHRGFEGVHSRDLWHALASVAKGRIPLNAFEDGTYDRASNLRVPRRSSDEWFVSNLQAEGLLETGAEGGSYRDVCSSIASLARVKGRHLQVQDFLLKNNFGMVAMEVPVWSGFLRLTGHIDLIRLAPDCLQVVDYKPEGHFLRSMPQVAVYAFLLDSCYPTMKIENMECVSFNEKEAWVYSPGVLRHLAKRVDDGDLIDRILRRYDMMRGR